MALQLSIEERLIICSVSPSDDVTEDMSATQSGYSDTLIPGGLFSLTWLLTDAKWAQAGQIPW